MECHLDGNCVSGEKTNAPAQHSELPCRDTTWCPWRTVVTPAWLSARVNYHLLPRSAKEPKDNVT